ncbi:MAG: hypothetical protein LBV42_02310 [Methanobrevibacter sp.]|jgi:hypothetical protein|nr:hypothetical protein [Methanobrevibacter sp.]
MSDKNIPKTSNQDELFFSNTQSKGLKNKFKIVKENINNIIPKIKRLNREFGNNVDFNHYS